MEIEWGKHFNPVNQPITVEVEVKICNISYTHTIQINLTNPDVSFSYTPSSPCAGELISFSAV